MKPCYRALYKSNIIISNFGVKKEQSVWLLKEGKDTACHWKFARFVNLLQSLELFYVVLSFSFLQVENTNSCSFHMRYEQLKSELSFHLFFNIQLNYCIQVLACYASYSSIYYTYKKICKVDLHKDGEERKKERK